MANKQETLSEALKRKTEAAKKKAEEQKAAREKQKKSGFLNPLENACTYAEFCEELKEKKKGVEEYCKGKLEPEQIEWLKIEIENFKAKK